MNTKLNLLVAASLMLVGGTAMAESQYGYDSAAGNPPVTAKSDLDVVVKVPKLILLRVGGDNTTVTTATIQGAFSGIPGGSPTLTDGNKQASAWDGSAPALGDATSSGVTVRAWTNATAGGRITAAAVGAGFGVAGLAAMVTVGHANDAAGGALVHPGTDLATLGQTDFLRNTVVGSDWTFSVTGADLATLPAGSYSQKMRYTATSL